MGHENLGQVVEVGSAVVRVKVGDYVCLPFNIGCGFCKNCEKGLTGFCLSDKAHVGIVDRLEGERLKLTHHDSQADDKHHFLPLSAVASVDEFVTLSITAAEAESQWEEEQ